MSAHILILLSTASFTSPGAVKQASKNAGMWEAVYKGQEHITVQRWQRPKKALVPPRVWESGMKTA